MNMLLIQSVVEMGRGVKQLLMKTDNCYLASRHHRTDLNFVFYFHNIIFIIILLKEVKKNVSTFIF